MLATLLGSSSVGFTPPGLLAGLVDQKRREVEKLYRLPDSREDGPWGLRLRYPASEGSYKLARSIGWRRDTLAVLADLKRASPGSALGVTESVDPQMDVMDAVQKVSVVCGAAVCGAAVWPSTSPSQPSCCSVPASIACAGDEPEARRRARVHRPRLVRRLGTRPRVSDAVPRGERHTHMRTHMHTDVYMCV